VQRNGLLDENFHVVIDPRVRWRGIPVY
jgi:hypothetical protein